MFCVCYFGGFTISDPQPCLITLYYSDFLIKGIKQPFILNKNYSFSVNITIPVSFKCLAQLFHGDILNTRTV